jgi:hypothetical protein
VDDCAVGTSPAGTIVIDGCDTKVTSGPGMVEALCECAASAKNHGQFVSCVAATAIQWRRQGLTNTAGIGEIVRCAAQADIP